MDKAKIEQIEKMMPSKVIKIVYSKDQEIRNKGSAGGFVSTLIKYLFDDKYIDAAVSYRYFGKELYVPEIIFNWEDYNQCGSIYHEVDLFRLLKNNLDKVKLRIVVVCLPCQCKAITRLFNRFNKQCLLISLVCSNQLSKDATYDFLKYNNIEINDVANLRYRGGGWPSGMQIEMNDGKKYFFHNNLSDWQKYFHSTIYTLRRCFKCPDMLGRYSDFVVADPWINRYIKNDSIGHSVVVVNTDAAEKIMENMICKNYIHLNEVIEKKEFILSQEGTLDKKIAFQKHNILLFIIKIYRFSLYKKLFNKFPDFHSWMHQKIMKIFKIL
nr:Coenzyme F420 hydrogenase/dehydrogenase, beta subunit C-terminal domain [uncultured Desulfobulbus sp.]